MSHFATPEGEQEGGPQEVAARPSGLSSDPQFYTALGRVALTAIEAEIRRAAYLSMVAEAFAPIALSSEPFGPEHTGAMVGTSQVRGDALRGASDGSAVRASAPGEAGGRRPAASGCSRCVKWDEIRNELYGELT